ncbi:YchF/TatD family DNA exonuclease [candidate division KSB1 bacterium]
MFIDSHAHLQFDSFDKDRESVIKRAVDNGVNYMINIGIDIETSRQSLEIARKHASVFSSVGLHPYEVESFDGQARKTMLSMLKDKNVVAVGEIGLDYYRAEVPHNVQKNIFKEQLKIAIDNDVPVIIHLRDAWDDIERVIGEVTQNRVKGVFHCYSGNLETALRLIKKGFYISFAGNITFRNYKKIEMLREIPIEKMLIETDAPFLAPHPYRGKRNEPGYIPLIAQRLADIKGLSVEDIGRITLFNANRLFGIAPEMEEEKVVYRIRDSLYINPTVRCTADCVFCARLIDPVVKGHNLNLTEEPTIEETIEKIGDPSHYKEVVFCGYGEPTIRLDFIKKVARWLKERGTYIRLNTNGHANLIFNRNIAPELKGLIDEVSVSVNTFNEEHYEKIMRTDFNEPSFNAMFDFMKKCTQAGIKTAATVVEIPGLDIAQCRSFVEEFGVELRVRKYNEVG